MILTWGQFSGYLTAVLAIFCATLWVFYRVFWHESD
jgi:hypothetical protein